MTGLRRVRPAIILGFAITVSVLFSSLIAGCWDKKELNQLAFVRAMGVDKSEAGIELTVQVAKPSALAPQTGGGAGGGGGGGGGTQQAFWTVSAPGSTPPEALSNLLTKSGRRFFLGHCSVIVIGEELARAGVGPFVDYMARDREIRETAWVLVSKGRAKETLNVSSDLERVPANTIEDMLRIGRVSSASVSVNLLKFVSTMDTPKLSSVVAGIEIVKETTGEKEKKALKLSGTAVFREDRLVGWMNEEETRGFLWITGSATKATLTVKCPHQRQTSIEVTRSNAEIEPLFEADLPTIIVRIREEGDLIEMNCKEEDPADPQTLRALEEAQAARITEEAAASVRRAKDLGADIFGFGEAFHRRFPGDWKALSQEWDSLFRDLEVRFDVIARIRRSGVISTPPKPA